MDKGNKKQQQQYQYPAGQQQQYQYPPGQQQQYQYPPGQQQQYPAGQQQQQPQYPTHSQGYNQPAPAYNNYSMQYGAAPPPPAYYPTSSYGNQQAGPNPYPTSQPAPPMYTQPQSGATVVMNNMYDPGARFDSTAQRNIPPPPPGCQPNAAQMAAIQGHNVVGTQKKSNMFWGGGNDGGWTW